MCMPNQVAVQLTTTEAESIQTSRLVQRQLLYNILIVLKKNRTHLKKYLRKEGKYLITHYHF